MPLDDTSCPPHGALDALLCDSISDDESQAIEEHLVHCVKCRQILQELAVGGALNWESWRELLAEEIVEKEETVPRLPNQPAIDGFRIVREIGRGGMGVVYEAEDRSLRRRVALKMLLAGAASGPERLKRFRNEAEAVAQLQHPHIVQIHSVGDANGLPFLVLEYLSGNNLGELRSRESLTPTQIADCLIPLAQAVQYAHDQGVIHRDIKPENILVDNSDPSRLHAKLTDFGLARQLESGSVTREGNIVGSPRYMAPELLTESIRGEAWKKADIYGLGGVLFYLLTGRPPVEGQSTAEVLANLTSSTTKFDIPEKRRIPRDLQVITMKCLERDPQHRYATPGDLSEDLRRFREHLPILAKPLPLLTRVGRTWKRHFVATSLIAALVLSFSITSLLWANQIRLRRQAATERAETNARLNSMKNDVAMSSYIRTVSEVQYEWSANNFETMQQLLLECPSELRSWEWTLLDRISREGFRTLPQLNSAVAFIELSPTGREALVGAESGQVRVIDLPSLTTSMEFKVTGKPLAARYSTDGERVAVRVTRGFHVLDSECSPVASVSLPAINALTWADDEVVAVTEPGGVFVYSPEGEPRRKEDFPIAMRGVAFRKGQLQLITVDERLLQVDPRSLQETGQRRLTFDLLSQRKIRSARFAKHGPYVLTGEVNKLFFFQGLSKDRSNMFAEHSGVVRDVSFSPSGEHVAACDSDGVIRILPSVVGSNILTLPRIVTAWGETCANGWIDDQRILVGNVQGELRLYDIQRLRQRSLSDTTASTTSISHEKPIRSIASSQDGQRILSGGDDGRLRLWHAKSLELALEFPLHPDRIRGLGFANHGKLALSACNDGFLRAYCTETGILTYEARVHDLNCSSMAVSPNGRYAAIGGGSKDSVLLWDLVNSRPIKRVEQPFERTVRCVAFSFLGTRLVASGGPEVHVLEVPSGRELLALPVMTGRSLHCSFSPDDRWIVTCGNDQVTHVWDATTGVLVYRFRNRTPLGFTLDARRLLLASTGVAPTDSKVMEVIDVESGLTICNFRLSPERPILFHFPPRSPFGFAACLDGRIRNWGPPAQH